MNGTEKLAKGFRYMQSISVGFEMTPVCIARPRTKAQQLLGFCRWLNETWALMPSRTFGSGTVILRTSFKEILEGY